jgi:hypothetical protein
VKQDYSEYGHGVVMVWEGGELNPGFMAFKGEYSGSYKVMVNGISSK